MTALSTPIKLALVLLASPILYSLLAHRRIIGGQKCILGPATEGGESEGIVDLFGTWLPLNDRQGNHLTRCELRHPSYMEESPANGKWGDLVGSASFRCDRRFSNFYMDQGVWCFIHSDNLENNVARFEDSVVVCQKSNDHNPPSGSYKSTKGTSTIHAHCNLNSANQSLRDTGLYPTTSFLLILNIGLAYIYWDRRIDPSTVCKQYTKIVSDMQLWRSFSGALAHFEAMHLLFNMMTLQSLGASLEPLFGSVKFLYYNICMIPLTTIIMMGLIRLQIKRNPDNEQYYAQTSSVGFSGVLFAWLVVSSLESHGICPIPFVQDMCFTTYSWSFMGSTNLDLKFNFGPFVELLLVHFIMPRASFIGHLSGIICGFLFHWRLLPTEIFWNPQVLIPFLLLLHWKFVRKIIPLRQSNESLLSTIFVSFDSVKDETTDNNSNDNNASLSIKDIEMKRRNKILVTTQRIMILTFITCLLKFGLFRSSMTLSQLLCCAMFTVSAHCYKNHQEGTGSGGEGSLTSSVLSVKSISRLLWRGCFITLLLALLTDAMVAPIWFVFRLMTYSNRLWSWYIWQDPLVMSLRWAVNFIAFIMTCLSLHDLGEIEEESVFSKVFGRLLNWSYEVYCQVFSLSSSSITPSSQNFGGSGYTLGGSSGSSRGRSRLVTMAEAV